MYHERPYLMHFLRGKLIAFKESHLPDGRVGQPSHLPEASHIDLFDRTGRRVLSVRYKEGMGVALWLHRHALRQGKDPIFRRLNRNDQFIDWLKRHPDWLEASRKFLEPA